MQLAAMYMDWSSFSFLSRSVAVYCKRSKQAKRRRPAEAAAAREGRPKIGDSGSMDNISRGVARSEECGVGERERREERERRVIRGLEEKKRQHHARAKRKTLYQLFF